MKHVVLLKSGAQRKGGLEKAANRIADAFLKKGQKVTLLTTGKGFSLSSHLNIVPFQTYRWPSLIRMDQFDRQVQSWINQEKPDIVFGMDRNRYQTHFRAGNGVHIAYLKSRIHTEGKWKYLTCLLNPMHRKILEIEKTAFENPRLEKIIANSSMVKNQILEHYRVDEKKIVVIHNGVEWHEMEEPFSKRRKSEVFHFLFVGNGYLRKGLKILLEACSVLKNRDFRLSVIGKDNHIDWFKKYTRKLNIQDKITFFGPVLDIIPFYQNADALVIPSFYDPFANVTVEALAMGLCVISSKSNGGHEVLNDENGIVIDEILDVESVVATLEKCLSRTISPIKIRNSVSHLDFSTQLDKLVKVCE
jgi:UDP-glucose:(heptosyl)LPS alpha-1,3-glucosyltransferase